MFSLTTLWSLIEFKKNQQLFKLKQDEKNFIAEVAGAEASTKSLQSKIMK